MCVENRHVYYIPVNYNNYKVEYNVQKKVIMVIIVFLNI